MSLSDSGQFQSADKQLEMQVLQMSCPKEAPIRKHKNQNNIMWKYEAINNNKNESIPRKISKPKNICFETDQQQQQDASQESTSDQRSSLYNQYAQYQQLYKKSKSMGTHWISNKEYFASIFIDPTRIQLNQNKPFSLFLPEVNHSSSKNIQFDSNFESGNLFAAYKIGQFQYDLIMQNDINTKGNTQWFYFRISNVPANQDIKINIVNMMKPDSLFNYGMLPCVHSAQAELKSGTGWVRKATKVSYYKNTKRVENSKRYYYTLSFTISSTYQNDVLKIAQCFPYTLTNLKDYINNLMKVHGKKGYLFQQTIGSTLGKNDLEMLTIKENNPRKKIRQVIVIFARQHPGQTPGSFVCQGLIDYILSSTKQAQYLRKNCEFRIFPMLNPDGVFIGNYRTNLLGYDLNRRWNAQDNCKWLLQSLLLKNYLNQLNKICPISFILDLHGHSRKLFSFFYGNPYADPCQVRVFPYLCSKIAPQLIRFQDSSFAYEDAKRKTARIQLNLNFKIPYIYTFQVSFYGYIAKNMEKKHFSEDGFRSLGANLGKGLFIHHRQKFNQQSKEAAYYKKLITDLKNNPQLIKAGQCTQSGSQSDPSQYQLIDKEQKLLAQNEQYNERNLLKNKKFVKKVIKRQSAPKEIQRTSRNMQMIEIARVNSIFPNDLLALIPSSFLKKIKKQVKSVAVQTDEVPFIKIYEACKIQELKIKEPNSNKLEKMARLSIKKSNLFQSNIRPRSSTHNCLQIFKPNKLESINNSSQYNTRDIPKKIKQQITANEHKSKNSKSEYTQTVIALSSQVMSTSGYFDKTSKQIVQPKQLAFSTLQPTKLLTEQEKSQIKMNGFKVGLKAINVDTWKLRKKIS